MAPVKSTKLVYRLVNNKTGRSLYTTAKRKSGWKNRGRAFYAQKTGGVKVYRLCHKTTGAYILTTSPAQAKRLKQQGYKSPTAAFRVAS